MEFSFAYILLTRLTRVNRKLQIRFGITAAALSVDTLGMLAGGIVSFFYGQLGTQIVYSFWLVNVWVFLMMNEQVNRALRKRSSSMSGGSGKSDRSKASSLSANQA